MIAGCLAAAAGFGTWFWFMRFNDNRGEHAAFENVDFRRERLEVTIEATGIVEPENRLQIKPPIGGRMDEVLVQEGQSVKEGEIIAWMSSMERAALLDAARAEGAEALEKWKRVYKPTPIIAPLDGTIIARKTDPGQTFTVQDVVFVLSDRLIIKAEVDETDIGMITEGQQATGVLDAYPDTRLTGAVSHIAFEALTVNNVTIYQVKVIPNETPKQMKSGMTATVRFLVTAVDDALTLPVDAVTAQDGKSAALVDDGNPESPPERWRVLTGLRSAGRVEILAGLEGHEKVVKPSFKMPEKKEETSPFVPSRRRSGTR